MLFYLECTKDVIFLNARRDTAAEKKFDDVIQITVEHVLV